MNDKYTQDLVKTLVDVNSWPDAVFSEGFNNLIEKVKQEVDANSVSGKIAAILLQNQIMQEMTKQLIELSILYVQGELWPTEYDPVFDKGKEQMTGWYIEYFEKHCINCENKDEFIKNALEINRLRNKVVHNIVGKNDSIIDHTYSQFINNFAELTVSYTLCIDYLVNILSDLNRRVNFREVINDIDGNG